MSERPEQDDYEEDDDLDSGEDVDRAMRDIDRARRRSGSPKGGDPAWRRLERLREDKHTAELVSDFDDYDIGIDDDKPKTARRDR
ncbi:MAG: hypothetical protein FGM43_11630 [Sinobacteraceae bacterium]|nr:hypothetical protein [Nevskiaceae bacterium]